MSLCYLKLFDRSISAELYDLHTVKERLRYRVGGVGRTNEKHIRKVVRNIHIVVGKGIILLRVEHFKKSARRASVEGIRELVHLIEHHNRIGHTALLDSVHDPARHRPYICAAMSANIRFIMHTAEAHPYIFAAERSRDALSYACFSCARSSYKEKYRAGLLLSEVHHGDLLDYAIFDPRKPVMVFIEYTSRVLKIDIYGFLLLPGQTCDEVEIVIEHAGFSALLTFLFETVEDFVRFLSGGLIHARLFYLLLELTDIRYVLRMHLIEFFLEMFHLALYGLLTVHPLMVLLL